MSEAIWQIMATVFVAIIAIAPPLLRLRSERNKTHTDIASALMAQAMEMVKTWENRTMALESRIIQLEADNRFLKMGGYRLARQLTQAGIEPCWIPNGDLPSTTAEDT